MHISWVQTAWYNVRGEKRAWRWKGTRKDGRSFKIIYIPKDGYVCLTFNGSRLGVGKSLAEAQKIAEKAPAVEAPIKVAA